MRQHLTPFRPRRARLIDIALPRRSRPATATSPRRPLGLLNLPATVSRWTMNLAGHSLVPCDGTSTARCRSPEEQPNGVAMVFFGWRSNLQYCASAPAGHRDVAPHLLLRRIPSRATSHPVICGTAIVSLLAGGPVNPQPPGGPDAGRQSRRIEAGGLTPLRPITGKCAPDPHRPRCVSGPQPPWLWPVSEPVRQGSAAKRRRETVAGPDSSTHHRQVTRTVARPRFTA